MDELALRDRICVITGATGGLGGALVDRFWSAGASLLLVGRNVDRLGEIARARPARDSQILFTIATDLSKPDAPYGIARFAEEHFGAVDVLVNNAAIQGPIGPLADTEWPAWEEAIRVDLLAPAALCRFLLPHMRSGGKIVNISGGGATGPRPNFTAYGTAKAGLVRLTECLAEELRGRNIDVNCVAPGVMNTLLLGNVVAAGAATAGVREVEIASTVTAGNESCYRAAELCLFLASAASNGITGKLISAVWDPWSELARHVGDLQKTDVYTLRRIVPKDRGLTWGEK